MSLPACGAKSGWYCVCVISAVLMALLGVGAEMAGIIGQAAGLPFPGRARRGNEKAGIESRAGI